MILATLNCVRGDYIKLFPHLERGEVNEYTPWAALLCGTIADVPTAIYSSGSGLVFEFHTGSLRGNATGFKGTFRFIDKRLFQSDGQRLPGTMCDHQFVSSDYAPSHGRFYSPRYPSSYPKNIRCSYRFRARTKERIRVVFEEVTLQKGDLSCLNRADLIKVHDGRNAMAPTIKMLCNVGTEMEVLSTGSDLYIEFVANSEWPGQGFKATYQFQPIDDNTSSSSSSSSSSASSSVSSSSSGAATDGTGSYSVVGPAVSAATTTVIHTMNITSTSRSEVTTPGTELGTKATSAAPTIMGRHPTVRLCPRGRC